MAAAQRQQCATSPSTLWSAARFLSPPQLRGGSGGACLQAATAMHLVLYASPIAQAS